MTQTQCEAEGWVFDVRGMRGQVVILIAPGGRWGHRCLTLTEAVALANKCETPR